MNIISQLKNMKIYIKHINSINLIIIKSYKNKKYYPNLVNFPKNFKELLFYTNWCICKD